MHLKEALKHLNERHSLYRTGWATQDGYIVLMPGMTHVWKIVLHPVPNAGNYIFSFEDLLASDWEKFDFNKQSAVAEPELIDTDE